MNWAHAHLLLNHLPVLGTLFGTLLLVTALVEKNDSLKRASLAVFVAVALLAVPVYLSGEPAEEIVEQLPGVSEAIVEAHEESAALSLGGAGLLGLLALVGWLLLRRARPLARPVVTATLVVAVAVGVLMARTAMLGGQIRHTEIRSDATPPPREAESP